MYCVKSNVFKKITRVHFSLHKVNVRSANKVLGLAVILVSITTIDNMAHDLMPEM